MTQLSHYFNILPAKVVSGISGSDDNSSFWDGVKEELSIGNKHTCATSSGRLNVRPKGRPHARVKLRPKFRPWVRSMLGRMFVSRFGNMFGYMFVQIVG